MEAYKISTMLHEAFEHLLQGRGRMALPLAEQLIKLRDNDSETAVCYAWALLENHDPVNAERYLKKSAEMQGDTISARMYRAYLQMRLSSFEGAVYDFNMTEGKQKGLLAWTYLNKAKTLAILGESEKASNFFTLALMIDNNTNPQWKKLKTYFQTASTLAKTGVEEERIAGIISLCEQALREKEYWSAFLASKHLSETKASEQHPEILLIEIEAMYKLNQFDAVIEKIEHAKTLLPDYERLQTIESSVRKYLLEKHTPQYTAAYDYFGELQNNVEFFPSQYLEFKSLRMYDFTKAEKERVYYSAINLEEVPQIGLEVEVGNKQFQDKEQDLNCFLAWYVNEDLIEYQNFVLTIPADSSGMIFTLTADTVNPSKRNLWRAGSARIELFVEKEKAAVRRFIIGAESIVEQNTESDKEELSYDIEQVFSELNSLVGLESIKKSFHELQNYIEFMKERKQLGLKSDENIVVHSLFLGNPGTGKTLVARLMGRLFKAMGLLPVGKVIEVDRSAIVGQYIGETAQKIEQIIESAKGSVLFIDEAYTLVKKGVTSDFGQEAIDVLLKRMEDKKGEFFVIAAGYPEEMNGFLDSNPGLKSRFTHTFQFDDYSPDEMVQVFTRLAKEEDYRLSEDAEKLLLTGMTELYRKRDKNFGNARTVKRLYEEAKLEVSNRYLQLQKYERTQEKLTTIYPKDIETVMKGPKQRASVQVEVNQSVLQAAIAQLDQLPGLSAVKREIRDIIKLANYYHSIGEDLSKKFSSHFLFLGNPGTGKTTVARIVGKIYEALAILPSGQLIETDRSGLVASYIGKTSEKTTEVINSSLGGTLFIDEAYSLVQGGENDFGKEAIDTLLKRMEDDRGKFVVIAAGYTDEMEKFIESNSGIKSRFTKILNFEDYTPEEMMDIFVVSCRNEGLALPPDVRVLLSKHFNKLYRERDKSFGNARVVRNLFNSANNRRMLRVAETPNSELTPEEAKVFTLADFEELTPSGKEKKSHVIQGDEQKLQSLLMELQGLTGLADIKSNVEQLVAGLKISRMRRERGMNVIDKSLHAVLTGNPGTGKTTVARLLSSIYKELGVVEKGHLVEVDRAQLVAGYTGQTAIKTDEVIKKSLGGVLFIDEAYSLARGGQDFGQEAIDTLLKRMEDYKSELIVFVAGYSSEMEQFLNSNPGLKSRFSNTFHFADYTPDELMQIMIRMAQKSGYEFTDSAKAVLEQRLIQEYHHRDSSFGNARAARNMLLQFITNQEARLAMLLQPSNEDLLHICEEDIR